MRWHYNLIDAIAQVQLGVVLVEQSQVGREVEESTVDGDGGDLQANEASKDTNLTNM